MGKHYGEAEWTQAAVAKRIGLTQNIVWRIEQGEGGKIENWLKVMGVYESRGYNLNWVLTKNNGQVSKLQLDEVTKKSPEPIRDAIVRTLDKHLTAVDEKLDAKMAELSELLTTHLRTP
ncbi:helix-turn-helix domain-containing protein [Hymenobacter setariae]|uniref:Helix-turn-helix domain-containing protein n=1 Tax=Hymenobacter setariae TaxID=2594794 RepID=A0A558BJU9_9BACT|nr:helix-turn-helix transcriptional regulator [Hymenobacter setariae]TVT36778.1 helix-turn-helix domain-containing protein [Hymenobacter setariae]